MKSQGPSVPSAGAWYGPCRALGGKEAPACHSASQHLGKTWRRGWGWGWWVNQLSSVKAMIKRPSKYGELSSTNRGFYYHVSYRNFNSYLTVLTTNIWVLGVNISHALLITYGKPLVNRCWKTSWFIVDDCNPWGIPTANSDIFLLCLSECEDPAKPCICLCRVHGFINLRVLEMISPTKPSLGIMFK